MFQKICELKLFLLIELYSLEYRLVWKTELFLRKQLWLEAKEHLFHRTAKLDALLH